MLDWMFVMFILMAIMFMLLAVEYHNKSKFWCTTFTLVDTVIWYLLAASVLEIEIPFALYNVTSESVETGSHVFTSKVAPEMLYFFMMMGSIMMIYGIGYILGPLIYETLFKKKWKT